VEIVKKYLVKGSSIEELINKSAKTLKVSPSDIKYEVLNMTKGMFGKIKEVELKIWIELPPKVICDENMENCIVDEKYDFEKDILEEEENKEEECFEIQILKSGIYLMVKKESETSKEKENYIFQEVLKREIKNPVSEEIKRALTLKKGEFVKIAEYDKDYYIDAKVIGTITKKDMEVLIEVTPPIHGNHITKENIEIEMQRLGIKFGIQEVEIDRVVNKKKYNETIVIACGKEPIDGEDAKIIHLFETSEKIEFKTDEMGKVNYKEMSNSVKNTKSGDIISRKIPATKGTNGINVFGKEVEAKPGKDKLFFKGKNVKESEDGQDLLSDIDGRVAYVNQMINVYPVLEIDGDIDLSVGNIDFVGTVFIKGKVSDGFSLKAHGDIIIDGVVEDAVVESDGNLFVKSGIVGKENGTGRIKIKGELKTKFIQNMIVEADGKIEIKDQILNSTIESKDSVIAFGGKGKIIGGKISATKEIVANEVGNDYETITLLEVGITPYERKRKHELEEIISKKYEEKSRNETDIKTLTNMKENGVLDEKKNKLYLEKVKNQFVIAKELKELEKEKERLERIAQDSKSGKIHVRNIMHPGVVFRIGDNQLNVKEAFKYVTFYVNRDRQEIALLPFERDEK
jgi:uncharacterized protein